MRWAASASFCFLGKLHHQNMHMEVGDLRKPEDLWASGCILSGNLGLVVSSAAELLQRHICFSLAEGSQHVRLRRTYPRLNRASVSQSGFPGGGIG